MRLRADTGEIDEALAEWWQEFSIGDDNQRQDLLEQAREEQGQRQRVRVVRQPADAKGEAPKAAPQRQPADRESTTEGEGAPAEGAPRKRRRRRKPGAGRGDAASTPGQEG